MKKTTLALIGRGYWGQVYKKTIDGMPNIFLPDQFIFGRDYKEGLKKINAKDIDGVIIAVSTSAHFEVARFLLNKGFNRLLIEKPLTQTYTQAKKLQKILQNIPQARVLVGHIMLYDPAYNIMKKISQNKLGKILQIKYSSLKTPPIKEATLLQDGGPHPIYIFMDIAGGKATKISARLMSYDNVELTLEFDNGLVGIANIGTIYPERKRQLAINGEGGKLILNEFVNPRELFFIDIDGRSKPLSFSTTKSPLEREIFDFVTYIKKGGKPKIPLSSGVEVVKIIELAEKSLREKGKTMLVNNP